MKKPSKVRSSARDRIRKFVNELLDAVDGPVRTSTLVAIGRVAFPRMPDKVLRPKVNFSLIEGELAGTIARDFGGAWRKENQ